VLTFWKQETTSTASTFLNIPQHLVNCLDFIGDIGPDLVISIRENLAIFKVDDPHFIPLFCNQNIRRSYVAVDNVKSMDRFERRQNLILHARVQIGRRERGTLFVRMRVAKLIL
jgi:hypothetical protein